MLVFWERDGHPSAPSTDGGRLSKQLGRSVDCYCHMSANLIPRERQSITSNWRCPLGFNQDFDGALLGTDIDSMLMCVPTNTLKL